MTKKKTLIAILDATLIRVGKGADHRPALEYSGDPVEVGAKITAGVQNGVTYTGTVTAASAKDGTHTIEFAGGLSPVTK